VRKTLRAQTRTTTGIFRDMALTMPVLLIEGRADDELAGTQFGTHVRYDWIVELTKPGMRLVAPVARPLFVWSHNVIMDRGSQDQERRLARATASAREASR
jgi:hypothetical protein